MNSSVAWPNGLTIDYVRQKIYWADARNDKIEVMNYDGSARRIILDRKLPHVFGFTVLGSNLYWTDWRRRSIESVNKRTGKNRKVLIDSLPDLMGLKAVNLNLSYGSNACQRNNGGCCHLCLYTPSGPKCECPTEMELLAEKKSCLIGGRPVVDGGYTKWSKWGPCSTTCDPGVKQKTRTCTNPPPQNGGKDCSRFGPARKFRICNKKPRKWCK